jgi:threonine aldolase
MRLHLDGARIFNAAAALRVEARELAAPADSVTFCLSKGLCAPVGSVLCGTQEFIHSARRIRKQLGGGMRQAGILAAAGIVALEEMTGRLSEDHERARLLARGLAAIKGVKLDVSTPPSNMVFIRMDGSARLSAPQTVESLAKEGVLVSMMGPERIRLVTHYWITDDAAQKALLAFQKILG